MKTIIHSPLAWTFIFIFSFSQVFSQNDKKKETPVDTAECLEFTGKFDESMKNLEGNYTVKLIRNNKVIQEENLKVKKSFKFILKKNMLYTIKVEKEGFIPRLFSISTNMSSKVDLEELFKFNFETNLISQDLYHQFDDDDMDFPLALISYSKKCDCFEYDKKYTAEIMTRIVNRLLYGA